MMLRILLLFTLLTTAAQAAPNPIASGAKVQPSFSGAVDLAPLDTLAVWQDGRLKSFDSFTRSIMQFITGPRMIDGQSPAFTYLDLIFRPGSYEDIPVIYVKKKPVRAAIINAALSKPGVTVQELDEFMQTGLVRPSLLRIPEVSERLSLMRSDVLRFAKPVDEITTAMQLLQPDVLRRQLFIIPPFSGSFDDPWQTLDGYENSFAQIDSGAAGNDAIVRQWKDLGGGWTAQNAEAVNAAIVNLGAWVPSMCRSVFTDYPSEERLRLESTYFKWKSFNWVWMIYLLAIILLLMGIVYHWRAASWGGLFIFLFAFSLHTVAIMLRWYISGRWPNTNMFEAVTTSTWFGCCFAILVELFIQRTRMRTLFALSASIAAMVALMAASFMPLHLSPHISNKMPVLHDVWLYIHTNVIIFSYVLIFLAAVSAILYLLLRAWRSLNGGVGIREYVSAGGVGSLIIRRRGGEAALLDQRTSFGAVLDGTTMILVELSFILLWAGLVMGAIWADHSWGRPWGWDPKEVFALNTFLIYAILIHVRWKSPDKGFWTALLAVIGCAVMLFNWIIINFTISGLHSYA